MDVRDVGGNLSGGLYPPPLPLSCEPHPFSGSGTLQVNASDPTTFMGC